MANTYFRIGRSTVTSEPAEPPLAAWPLVPYSPIVQYPKASKRDGYGKPAGVVGLPWVEIGRNQITQTGLTWYQNLFLAATDESVAVKCKLYDQRSATWKVYSGTLWRPATGNSVPGKAYTYADFKVTISDLTELAGWS